MCFQPAPGCWLERPIYRNEISPSYHWVMVQNSFEGVLLKLTVFFPHRNNGWVGIGGEGLRYPSEAILSTIKPSCNVIEGSRNGISVWYRRGYWGRNRRRNRKKRGILLSLFKSRSDPRSQLIIINLVHVASCGLKARNDWNSRSESC